MYSLLTYNHTHRDLTLTRARTQLPMCTAPFAACIIHSLAIGSAGQSANADIRSLKSALIS